MNKFSNKKIIKALQKSLYFFIVFLFVVSYVYVPFSVLLLPEPVKKILTQTQPEIQKAYAAAPSMANVTETESAAVVTEFNINMPATRPDGDLYIAVIGKDDDVTFSVVPSNWNEIYNFTDGQGGCTLGAWWWVGDNEPASYAVGDDSEEYSGAILRIENADTVNPIHTSDTATGSSDTPTAPSVMPTMDNTVILYTAAIDSDSWDTTDPYPSGTEGQFDIVSTGGGSGSGNTAAATKAGVKDSDSGTGAFLAQAADTWAAGTIAIAPYVGATISSAADQIFEVGQSATEMSMVTITDVEGGITSANDLRIAIATTSGVHMLWDSSDAIASTSGSAVTNGRVTNPVTVTFEGGNSVIKIPVGSSFSDGETLFIDGLNFTDFGGDGTATSSTALTTSALILYLDGQSDISANATDDKSVTIKGKVTLDDHTLNQVSNKFESGVAATTTEFFRFNADLAGERASSTITFNLSNITGVETADITDVKLYVDTDGDGEVTASSSWSTAANTSEGIILSLTFDSTNNIIYAGTYVGGTILRCDNSTGCDVQEEWSTVYDDATETRIISLTFDSTKNVIYAGTGAGGTILRCDTSTGCDSQGDWNTVYDDATETYIYSLTFDSTNNVIYAEKGIAHVINRVT